MASILARNEKPVPFPYTQESGVIALMDRGGSNVAKLGELIPGVVKLVVTADIYHPKCNAVARAEKLEVPLVKFSIPEYERSRGVAPKDYLAAVEHGPNAKLNGSRNYQEVLDIRRDACRELSDKIQEECQKNGINPNVPFMALGMMQILDGEFVDKYRILNVHPGGLDKYTVHESLVDGKLVMKRGGRMLRGDGWVPSAKALLAGHNQLYSSIHMMTSALDAGPIFMKGYPLHINYNEIAESLDLNDPKQLRMAAEAAQDALKVIGDHVIVGATLRDMFAGKWGQTSDGTLAYKYENKWMRVPNGISVALHADNDMNTPFVKQDVDLTHYTGEFYRAVRASGAKASSGYVLPTSSAPQSQPQQS